MDAAITNAITNGLHALCLLLYFLGAWRQRGRAGFTAQVVGMFGLLFVLKVMGVYVHGRPPGPDVQVMWFLIALLVVLLNALVLRAVGASTRLQIGAVVATAVSAAAFVQSGGDFAFLALPSALVFIAAALLSRGLLRTGFWMVVGSNFAWIAARKISEAVIGNELPVSLRYDNDAYHFLLIASTYVIYKGFARRS